MIEVRLAELAAVEAGAVIRPVASDFSPVTGSMRRLDEVAGPSVAEQCERLGELPVGSAVITAAGGLSADYLVHVAIRAPDENCTPAIVRRGLLNGLRRLEEWQVESVAVAPLGTGAGNLEAEESADAMLPVLAEHLASAAYPRRVVLVVEDEYQRAVFSAALDRHAVRGSAPPSPSGPGGAGG